MTLLLLLLIPFLSFAETCGTVNYLTTADSPFEKIPVGDQDGAGICYAFSTAHLMNYHLIKTHQASEQVIHPAWVALKTSRRILEGGFEGDAINAVRNSGSCNYPEVESALSAVSGDSEIRSPPLIGLIENYAIALGHRSTGEDAFNHAVDLSATYCEENVFWERLQPRVTELQGTSVQIFNRLFAGYCSGTNIHRYHIPAPRVRNVQDDAEAAGALNLISTGPVVVSYCATTWGHPGYRGLASPRNYMAPSADCGSHSSLIVGRKKIGNTCHMLVRNSYGPGWGNWNADSKCICRHKVTREWVDECNYSDHSNGEYSVEACYISKEQLGQNTSAITAL